VGELFLTRNVFVAGGIPDVTYNPRDDRRLESEVRAYLDQTGKALSLSGPTKSGKTVLVKRLLPETEAIWMHGSDLTSTEVFWRLIVDWLNLYDEIEVSYQRSAQHGAKVGGSLGVPGAATISGSLGGGAGTSDTSTYTRTRAWADVAREGLRDLGAPIVIDDFHYVPDDVKRDIARAIKSLIPITHVVMIAVPHEAFEAVREEPDMGGRVWHQKIELWSPEELTFIATSGFTALNLVDPDEAVTKKLVDNSFGAPFLMQQLCYDVVTHHKILQTQQGAPVPLPPEPDGGWAEFFERIASRSTPPVFDHLRRGPKTRGQERVERRFKDGSSTDIYGAVLHAISQSGPKADIPQQDIVRYLAAELTQTARGQEVTNCLNQMSKIAEEMRGAGDPALVYKNDELHVLDPFLLFFLRWGTWEY
jgi:hypothetical protein